VAEAQEPKRLAWLIWKSGPHAGARRLLRGPVTRVGRSPDNDLVVDGEEAAGVSGYHAEIRREGDRYRLVDLDSTNGTWVDGKRVTESDLGPSAELRLGSDGPQLQFLVEELPDAPVDRTIVIPPAAMQRPKLPPLASSADPAISRDDERLLSAAVARARSARRAGAANQTMILMRDVLEAALHRSGRRFKRVIAGLVVALVVVSVYAAWRIQNLQREKDGIDRQIQQLEIALEQGSSEEDTEKLIERLDQFQQRARLLQQDVFYRLGSRGEQEDTIRRGIRELMTEFGAEVYSMPPEFVQGVKRYIEEYQGPNRPTMERALGAARKDLEVMRQVFREEQLPPDLVYIVLVESAFLSESLSRAGALGLWQFTPHTARAYGLRVTKNVDERLDTRKATRAGSKYIRELILEFGAGSSVMLALAAYNSGPGKVRAAVRRTVANPIKQRDFWYLYRARALPAETREYVPKVIAAMLIGRNPSQFGF
jgi:soluble lytic murein transglycosylase-like protein